MLELMMFTGAVIVAVVIYLLIKGHEARVVLIGAGTAACPCRRWTRSRRA